MLALIGLIPRLRRCGRPNILWKLFDMFIGGIQAFIFALLTVLYFGMAGAGHDEHETTSDEHDEKRPDTSPRAADRRAAPRTSALTHPVSARPEVNQERRSAARQPRRDSGNGSN